MDYNAIFWKSKAVRRNQEIKELKKRIAETKKGRDAWKAKYMIKSTELAKSSHELNSIKKKLEKILKS